MGFFTKKPSRAELQQMMRTGEQMMSWFGFILDNQKPDFAQQLGELDLTQVTVREQIKESMINIIRDYRLSESLDYPISRRLEANA